MHTLGKWLSATLLAVPLLVTAEGLKFQGADKTDSGYENYTGQITVTGKYYRDFDNEVMGDGVCFMVNKASAKLIPRRNGDQRAPWFCFSNQQTAINTFKIAKKPAKGYCRYAGQATVTVNRYATYVEESEGSDLAQLLSASKVSPAQATKCSE